jgi:hypothetical protein
MCSFIASSAPSLIAWIISPSLIPFQFAFSPMGILARRIEHPLDMPVQRACMTAMRANHSQPSLRSAAFSNISIAVCHSAW